MFFSFKKASIRNG